MTSNQEKLTSKSKSKNIFVLASFVFYLPFHVSSQIIFCNLYCQDQHKYSTFQLKQNMYLILSVLLNNHEVVETVNRYSTFNSIHT